MGTSLPSLNMTPASRGSFPGPDKYSTGTLYDLPSVFYSLALTAENKALSSKDGFAAKFESASCKKIPW